MENRFRFEPKTHSYFLDGKPMTGCTTVLSVIAKPALIQWAANMAVQYAKESAITIENSGKDVIYHILHSSLEEARTAHRRKKEDAGQKGTDVHAIAEEMINDAINNNLGYIKAENLFHENLQIKHFVGWAGTNKVKFLESEKQVYSEKYWIAGTCDFTCEIDGRKYVGDIKTSSGIYDRTPMAQCAGYRLMMEEMGDKDFVGSIIVNIKKDGTFSEDNDVYLSEDYKEDLRLFLGALEIYCVLNTDVKLKVGKNYQNNKK